MYESYPWPGAYSLKTEMNMFKRILKDMIKDVFKFNKNKKK